MARPKNPVLVVALEWIEAHCVVPDGFRKGDPLTLYNYQLEFLAEFYRVKGNAPWVPDNPVLAPAFVYRRGLLVGPQKVGKNPMVAAQICLEGVGPALFGGWAGKDDGYACADHGCPCGWEYPYEAGEPMGMLWPTPLIQITAFSEESTENTYDVLRPMIEEGPLADVIPRTGEEFIRLPGGGRIDTVTSSAKSRLGQRVTFVPQDEVGIWTKANKMEAVADTQYRGLAGMGGRAVLTTNQWDKADNSVAQREWESKAKDVLRYELAPPKNPTFRTKKARMRVFRAVYPPDTLKENGGHVDLASIDAEFAAMAEYDPAQAIRFFGNVSVTGAGAAVDPDQWKKLAKRRDLEPGERVGLGFDGSISDDCTALVATTADGHQVPLRIWTRPANTPNWRVPRTEVKETIALAFETYDVGLMYADEPKWWSEIEEWQATYGEDRVLGIPTYSDRRFAPMVDRWLTDIDNENLSHSTGGESDDELERHVLAAQKRKARAKDPDDDSRTLYTLVKPSDGRKIDAAVAAVLSRAAAAAMDNQPDPEPFFSFA